MKSIATAAAITEYSSELPDPAFDPRPLYDIYVVTVKVRVRLCGGMPRNKDLIKSWVEAKTGYVDEKSDEIVKANLDLVVNEVAEKTWIGFAQDSLGIFLECRNMKAMLKQSASVLGITNQKRGSKQIFAEGMEVKAMDGGDRIRLGKEPSGTHENPIHVMTAQGPRTALRRMDYVSSPVLEFQIWVLGTAPQEKRHIGAEELASILMHAQENGLGASRSQGEGKFDVIGFKKLSSSTRKLPTLDEPKGGKRGKKEEPVELEA